MVQLTKISKAYHNKVANNKTVHIHSRESLHQMLQGQGRIGVEGEFILHASRPLNLSLKF